METAARLGDLKAMGRLLEERLQSDKVLNVPFKVQCALQKGVLLVMAQHAAPALPQVKSSFSTLEQAIQTLQPEFTKQVSLFFRVAGQKQPYAVHEFAIQEPSFSSDRGFSDLDNTLALEDPDEYQVDPVEESEPEENWTVDGASEQSELESEFLEEETPEWEAESNPSPKQGFAGFKLPLPVLAAGAGVAAVLFLGVLYGVTRPCVMGECVPLEKAQQLSQESSQTLVKAKSGQDLLAAKKPLTEASQLLQGIPLWSSHYKTAQNLLQTYKTESQRIEQVLTAFNQAMLAAQKSQNPPHSVQRWQEIQGLWLNAIAQLKQVQPDNPLYRLAQQKLADYQLNLATINQRLKTQQQAEQKITEAKQMAQLAESRQATARSLDNWQQVYSSWQTAVTTLASVPKTATTYVEAQQLLETYRTKLAASRDRRTKEQISANNYNQAISLAALAKRLEQQNQWTQAVITWRQALNYVDQVPSETFYYAQSQQLSDAYANALKQAEERLKVALVFQKARTDLEKTCSGAPRICYYTVSDGGIKVYLTPTYVNRVIRTAVTADVNSDLNTQVDLQDHLQTLKAALEAISQNASIPLELYDHRRSLIGRHTPR